MLIINSKNIRRHTSCHGVGYFKLNFVHAEGAEARRVLKNNYSSSPLTTLLSLKAIILPALRLQMLGIILLGYTKA